MAKILIVNASPRAPRSNSKQYAAAFAKYCRGSAEYEELSATNADALCLRAESAAHLVLVFPLYADALPVTLLRFLTALGQCPMQARPQVSAIINCGFIEPEQNDVAIDMLRLFCRQNSFAFGSVLKIGGGEAIWTTPFRPLVAMQLRKLAAAIERGQHRTLQVSMPITKRMFLQASTRYWIGLGQKNGITEEQMRTMQIE